jgi:hypothetical protein
MRCLGVAEQWVANGGKAEFWGRVSLPFVAQRAKNVGIPVVETPSSRGTVLLVDVYDDEERCRLSSSEIALRRVLVDDLFAPVPSAYHAVWNPNPYGDSDLYQGFDGAVIAGLDVVPVRKGLQPWLGDGLGAVSFGGGRLPDALRDAVTRLPGLLGLSTGLGVGEFLPPGWRTVSADNPWSDLRHASWLISAAGSTLWEAAVVGIPIMVVIYADNQELAGAWAARQGVPTMDVRGIDEGQTIAAQMAAGISRVRQLPPLRSGSESVARRLLALAS